jgi:hypothetical protein
VLHKNRFEMPTSTLIVSAAEFDSTYGYSGQRDASDAVAMVGVVSTDDVNTLGFPSFYIILPS